LQAPSEALRSQDQKQKQKREHSPSEGVVSLSGSDSTAPPPPAGKLGDTARALWSEYADERDRLRAAIAPTSLATPRNPGAETPVANLLRAGVAEQAIRNTVTNAVAEAEHTRSMRWLESGVLFTEKRVATVGGLSIEDYRREYLGGKTKTHPKPGNVVTGDPDKFFEEFSFD
jgi:hypothetical protein